MVGPLENRWVEGVARRTVGKQLAVGYDENAVGGRSLAQIVKHGNDTARTLGERA